jgi:hypothetical protein
MPWQGTRTVTVVPVSAPIALSGTGTYTSPQFTCEDALNYVNVEVVTTAAGGTSPSMVWIVQWSFDGGVTWSSSDGGGDTWNAITAVGQKMRQSTVKGPLARLSGTLSGTSPTMSYAVRVHLV